MKKQATMACLLAWALVCCLAGPSPAVKFHYENLGNLGGSQPLTSFGDKLNGINDLGQVVGHSFTPAGKRHAFFKAPGQPMQDLGLLSGGDESFATCINHSGVIGGYYADASGNHACLWVLSGGVYTFQDLGGTDSQVLGLNDAGYAVGNASTGSGNFAHVKPPGGTPVNLGALPGGTGSVATGINSSRTIVGYSYAAGIFSPCFWSPSGGGYTAAAPLFGDGVTDASALAVNKLGQASGWWRVSGNPHAVLKSPGETLLDLGLLHPWHNYSNAYDVNDYGWVVGASASSTTAFLWTREEGMQDLNLLVANHPPNVTFTYAAAINRQGQIAGYTNDNTFFKLTPIVEPPFPLLLLD